MKRTSLFLVIHGDIKPSNVLVGFGDGRPVPKIIDFGVAKATEQPSTRARGARDAISWT